MWRTQQDKYHEQEASKVKTYHDHDISINISGNTKKDTNVYIQICNILKFFEHRLGSDRGFGKPYRARPDRCFSIDEDEDGPRYPEDYF